MAVRGRTLPGPCHSGHVSFRERVRPPVPLVILGALAAASFGLILVPLSTGAAAVAGACLAAAAVAFALLSSPVVAVDETTFRAGRARIEGRFLGSVCALDRRQLRVRLGVEADARAYVLHRAFARAAVEVALRDERDPAPYWLVSTNRPTELAQAVRALVARTVRDPA